MTALICYSFSVTKNHTIYTSIDQFHNEIWMRDFEVRSKYYECSCQRKNMFEHFLFSYYKQWNEAAIEINFNIFESSTSFIQKILIFGQISVYHWTHSVHNLSRLSTSLLISFSDILYLPTLFGVYRSIQTKCAKVFVPIPFDNLDILFVKQRSQWQNWLNSKVSSDIFCF